MLLTVVAGLNFSVFAMSFSGSCGNSITYSFNSSNGVLTISGTGDMTDYTYEGSPFYGESSIKKVIISNGVTSIGNQAFDECEGLTSITIPESVTRIGDYAFQLCTSLKSITIPDSVTSIGDFAFFYCSGLKTITISDNVTHIGKYAFCTCASLQSINVNGSNPSYCSANGVLFNKSKSILIQYPIGNSRKSYTIPNNATSISIYAFEDCTELTCISIPDSITSINSNAFKNCTELKDVYYSGSIDDWKAITKNNNEALTNANIHYDCESPCVSHTRREAIKENEIAATCTEKGSYDSVIYCSVCEAEISRKRIISDEFIHAIVIDKAVNPTCTEIGLTEGSHCSKCGKVIISQEVIPALGHEHAELKTCTSCRGYGTITTNTEYPCFMCDGKGGKKLGCSTCNATGQVTTTVQETVTCPICHGSLVTWSDSLKCYVNCAFCGATGTVKHSVTKTSTCSSCFGLGYYNKACSYCNGTGKEVFTDTKTCNACVGSGKVKYVGEVVAPNCIENGYTTYICSHCGESYRTDFTERTNEHKYIGEVTIQPTCTSTGVKTYTCSCGDSYTVDIPKSEHIYSTKNIKATTSNNGSITTSCDVCGDIKSNQVIYCPKSYTLSASNYTYDGKVKKPTVTVKDSKGNIISANNYTVTYTNNKNVGKATVKITFKGNYSGTVSKNFTINPKPTKITSLKAKSKGFKVKWSKVTAQADGYQIQYSASSSFKSVKTVTVKGNKNIVKTVSKLRGKKKYYVRVRAYKKIGKATYYSAWSKTKSVKTGK